jgi:hypothetical protein
MDARLNNLRITGQILTGKRLFYSWHDHYSFVEKEYNIFIHRIPIKKGDEKIILAIHKAINFKLCSQVLFVNQNVLKKVDPLLKSLTLLLEGHRCLNKLTKEYPGISLYSDLFKIMAIPGDTVYSNIYYYLKTHNSIHLPEIEELLDQVEDSTSTHQTLRIAKQIISTIDLDIPGGIEDSVPTLLSVSGEDEDSLEKWLEADVKGPLELELEREKRLQQELRLPSLRLHQQTLQAMRSSAERLEQSIDWGETQPKFYELHLAKENKKVFDLCLQRMSSSIHYFTQFFKQMLFNIFNARIEEYAQKRGKPDRKRMARIAVNDIRIFKKMIEREGFSFVFYLLIDGSGSMGRRGDRKREHARDAALLFSEVLDTLNIPFEVAWHCSDLETPFSVQHYFVKRFEEPYYQVKYRLGDSPGLGNNDDGASIHLAQSRLDQRPELLKYLFVIGDGNPSGLGRPREFLKETMRLYSSRSIIAIGDPHANLGEWYRWYIKCESYNLTNRVANILLNSMRWLSNEWEQARESQNQELDLRIALHS